ncbi:hypothetical protein BpHYR1_044777, partial [Brachionus plicatilis]
MIIKRALLNECKYSLVFNDLIEELLEKNLGAIYNNLNVSADDIMLISPVDKHLQSLLDTCGNFVEFYWSKKNNNKFSLVNARITRNQGLYKQGTSIIEVVSIDFGLNCLLIVLLVRFD